MRQGQQNRRGRGRNNNSNNNNNNRKNQNPLTRSFESSGPDVKIRGTPAHIAEKYISLARDALSSGDPVLAENYMQHAEHYNRIIMAYREQQIQQGGDPGPAVVRRPQVSGDFVENDEFTDEDGDESGADGGQPMVSGNEPQPVVRGFEVRGEAGGGEPRYEPRQEHRNERRHEHGRQEGGRPDYRNDHRRGDFQPRHGRQHRNGDGGQGGSHVRHDNPNRHEQRGERRPEHRAEPRVEPRPEFGEPRMEPRVETRVEPRPEPRAENRPEPREPRFEPRVTEGRPEGGRRSEQPSRRPPRDQFGASEQPEFLRRPVRRPRREVPAEGASAPAPAQPVAVVDEGGE